MIGLNVTQKLHGDKSQAYRAVGLSLAGNALAGLAGTAAALYPIGGSAAVVGFLRLIIGSLSLMLLAPFLGGKFSAVPKLFRKPAVWIMALTSATYQALFFASVERVGVATAALVTIGCIPVSAGLIGWLALKERPNLIWFIATTVAIAGLTIRSLGELQANNTAGILFAVIAGTGIGGYLNAAKVEIRAGSHPMLLPATAYLIGSIGLFFIVRAELLKVQWSPQVIGTALFLGVVTMGLANALQILGLHGIAPGVAATMMLVDPVAAALLGVFVMHEELTAQGALGLALVLAGLVLQSFAPEGKPATK